jgi:hypothetical protein
VTLRLFMDHHVRAEITDGLRRRGVDVLTAQEDRSHRLADPALLTRCTLIGRVLFTNDDDLLAEAARRMVSAEHFSGVIYAHQLQITIGKAVDDLELIARVYDPPDIANQIQHLPL